MKKFLLVLAAMFGCSVLTDFQPLDSETQAQCFDGTDNDSDGATDCADTDCSSETGCLPPPVCGDGTLDAGEDCEGQNLDGQDCAGLGFAGGVLACANNCAFDTSACTNNEICNNGQDDDADGQIDCADNDCAQDPVCAPPCGNGSLDVGEDCDGGNLDGQDCAGLGFAGGVLACANDCSFNTGACIAVGCGNSILDPGESCDDGNVLVGDGCNANCQLEICGDGVVNNNGTEQCDDGDTDNGDGCDAACALEFCGDGIVNNSSEECDDGNFIDGDGCDAACVSEVCGDGIVNNGSQEQCDDGNLVGGDGCDAACLVEFCGDGIVNNSSETCDDANATAGDGCDAVCVVETGFDCVGSPSVCTTICGDGFIAGAETCDDGNVSAGDGCNAVCILEFCGDGVSNNGEQCDDGNNLDGDGCNALCVSEFCGDGIVNNGSQEQCDDGNLLDGDGCDVACAVETGFDCVGSPSVCTAICGDGLILGTEECDDGNTLNGDGCDAACLLESLSVVQVATGGLHTCALLSNGKVRCWGRGSEGQLGYANTNNIGDNETPASAGDVNVGGTVVQLAAGGSHTCALLNTGSVRCWGANASGQLGYGNTNNIGDDETPASAGDVNVGGFVVQITAGGSHTCAILNTGSVRCWGDGGAGRLGYGNTSDIGDDETPNTVGDVNVGGTVAQVTAGGAHTCALLTTGKVRCWGFGGDGRLGYGNPTTIGDNESPASAGDVDMGGSVVQVAAGGSHNCAILSDKTLRCWGIGQLGVLGYGNTNNIGDDETPSSVGPVAVNEPVLEVSMGNIHTCALLESGNVTCWGDGIDGRLGRGTPTGVLSLPPNTPISLGGQALQISAAPAHTCALLNTGLVRCWGFGGDGRLGGGNSGTTSGRVGDDETPGSVAAVSVF